MCPRAGPTRGPGETSRPTSSPSFPPRTSALKSGERASRRRATRRRPGCSTATSDRSCPRTVSLRSRCNRGRATRSLRTQAGAASVSVAPKWADGAWRRIASGRGCSEGRRGVCLQEGLERDSLEVPRTEVRGIGGNRKILGNGQSESMDRWHEQARLRRALSSMCNQVFGALPPAALGGAALGKRVGPWAFGR